MDLQNYHGLFILKVIPWTSRWISTFKRIQNSLRPWSARAHLFSSFRCRWHPARSRFANGTLSRLRCPLLARSGATADTTQLLKEQYIYDNKASSWRFNTSLTWRSTVKTRTGHEFGVITANSLARDHLALYFLTGPELRYQDVVLYRPDVLLLEHVALLSDRNPFDIRRFHCV